MCGRGRSETLLGLAEFFYGRWPYFLQKCRFYRYYYPTMTWGQRADGLLRAISSGVVGYRNRNWSRSACERLAAVWNADWHKREPYSAEGRKRESASGG